MSAAYRLAFSRVLSRLDAERSHALAIGSMEILCALPGARAALARRLAPRDDRLAVSALGLAFPSPLGAAAGLDKDARWFAALGALGFGFVEVGTVTAVAQAGNPERPRILRVGEEGALINRLGFPNEGAAAVARRLAGRTRDLVLGANIGKSRDTPLERAEEDYRALARVLAPHVDYLTVNVSSPNTPQLRDMQSTERLRALVLAVRAELAAIDMPLPLLVKISPDLDPPALDAIADLALDIGIDGIVAANTTADRGVLGPAARRAAGFQGGGVSGAPLKRRAVEVLRTLRARVGDRVSLISVGGIETAEDVWERVLAGATLTQAYTAFIYRGPGWPHRVNAALARRVRESGHASIQDLVGADSA